MATKPLPATAANDQSSSASDVSPISKELIVGLVGHAGAGTSTAGKRIRVLLEHHGYHVIPIKFSDLIVEILQPNIQELEEGTKAGRSRFKRAAQLQNLGDLLRHDHGGHALAVAAIGRVKTSRGVAMPGEARLAFVLDSLKHPDEVRLLRQVYDHSFRLVAVHCDHSKRSIRLIGPETSDAKYGGVSEKDVKNFMSRDSKDSDNDNGQRVRDVFHLADFFLDNSVDSNSGAAMNNDIERFVRLLLDHQIVRPTNGERAMYHAYAASLQSACLSRQVGAALMSADGTLVATGTNDPPAFGGGIYHDESKPDNRCFAWKFNSETGDFFGCHNDRKKEELYRKISSWLAENMSLPIATFLHPPHELGGTDLAEAERKSVQDDIKNIFLSDVSKLRSMPGVRDAIEYSRAIHAEMTAVIAAARSGVSTAGTCLYVTTYPCHNCARHLVAAGVSKVYYIEPYVKSLAIELHSDSIVGEPPVVGTGVGGLPKQSQMAVAPFTGVGPRMYEDFFVKRGELKGADGKFTPSAGGIPFLAVRLRELDAVENEALKLIPDLGLVNQ